MELKVNKWWKIVLIGACLVFSVIGFIAKLPSAFRHIDKELHTAFYFLAAAFLNILFKNKNVVWHIVIFGVLYLFSISIEFAQEYSNKLLHTKIHGRYDPEDIQSNLKGLIAFSVLWFVYVAFAFVYKRATIKRSTGNTNYKY